MTTKVTFVELPVFTGVIPLASGYMEAYCRKDPALAAAHVFTKISLPTTTPFEHVLARLEERPADVYAFSCYVWNAGMVRRLIVKLRQSQPNARFMLGGPQVMHQAGQYLAADAEEREFVCNGEGERTFANFLRALSSSRPDFSSVAGLSYYRGGQLVTTAAEPRISDLSEIPSPFLEGLFEEGMYTWTVIETNRGCPFRCNYCYWGAATGAKVYKFDEERLRREFAWISRSGCWYLFIADANWGMLTRDVSLSQFIVDCQKNTGSPTSVYFCGSKNTPERVSEITRIFHEAGLISCQSVALQTMSPEVLRLVNRDNIKTSGYTRIQKWLNEADISSFVEIIWPLPGETLESFQSGLAQLCEIGADSFVVYPLLLMNNVELAGRRQEYGLVSMPDPDPNSEAQLVVRTNEVDEHDYAEGMRFVHVVTSLYTLRGLWCLGQHLHSSGLLPFDELFRRFGDYAAQQPSHPWSRFVQTALDSFHHVAFSHVGTLVHMVLHAERDAFDELLEGFCRGQAFWSDAEARVQFEIDLVNRPYVYGNTPILPKRHVFEYLAVSTDANGYRVEVPDQFIAGARRRLGLPCRDGVRAYHVDHRRSQLPFMPGKSMSDHFMYCQDASQRMRHLAPLWQEELVPAPVVDARSMSRAAATR